MAQCWSVQALASFRRTLYLKEALWHRRLWASLRSRGRLRHMAREGVQLYLPHPKNIQAIGSTKNVSSRTSKRSEVGEGPAPAAVVAYEGSGADSSLRSE